MTTEPKPDSSGLSEWLHEVVTDQAESITEPLLVEGERKPFCWPHQFLLDGKTRVVTCRKCACEFLAFDALDYVAKNWKTYQANLDAMKSDNARLIEKRELLRKQVQSLKGMDKRLRADGDLVAGHIADWLEGVQAKRGREENRGTVKLIAEAIRNGDWRGRPAE